MTTRKVTTGGQASSCYFRTTTDGLARKALVQIDERCNIHCGHCFVSATRHGQNMPYEQIIRQLIPRLAQCRVERVTLTGGEPTIHPRVLDVVRAFRNARMHVGVCTNATTLDGAQIEALQRIGGVHCNVSLDGFSPGSHGKFRSDQGSFHTTIATVRTLAAAGLLQGLLCTPNALAEDDEYRELCQFAARHGADYVLLNPLSSMGRGVKSRARLAATEEQMRHIRQLTASFDDTGLDVIHIRFPSIGQPLAGCQADTIIYVFTRFNAPCLYWKAPASRPSKINGSRISSALLIGETLDAGTPFEGSLEVRKLFPHSVLLAEPGGTSHADSLFGNLCVDGTIARYLEHGTLPTRKPHARWDKSCRPLPTPVPTKFSSKNLSAESFRSLLSQLRGARTPRLWQL